MRRIVLPRDIQPGDVYLSTADCKPHWVDEVRESFWERPADTRTIVGGLPCTPRPASREPIIVLTCEGGRRIQVHSLELPVLIERPGVNVVRIDRTKQARSA